MHRDPQTLRTQRNRRRDQRRVSGLPARRTPPRTAASRRPAGGQKPEPRIFRSQLARAGDELSYEVEEESAPRPPAWGLRAVPQQMSPRVRVARSKHRDPLRGSSHKRIRGSPVLRSPRATRRVSRMWKGACERQLEIHSDQAAPMGQRKRGSPVGAPADLGLCRSTLEFGYDLFGLVRVSASCGTRAIEAL
jgi:hypothetical protein